MAVFDVYNDFKNKVLINRSSKITELLDSLNYNEKIKGITIVSKYNDDNDALEALNIFKNAKYDSIYELLINDTAIKGNISIEGARLINESREGFNAANALDVLCNKLSIENGLAIEGAKIINNSSNWYNAYYARYPLTSIIAIKKGIALESARIINESPNEFNALFASLVLCNEYAVNNDIAPMIAREINEANSLVTTNNIIDKYLIGKITSFEEDHLHSDEVYTLLSNNNIRKKVKCSCKF